MLQLPGMEGGYAYIEKTWVMESRVTGGINMAFFTEISEKDQTKDILTAKEIIERCMKDIKAKMYSFVFALSLLKPVPVEEEIEICTDGEKLFFHTKTILSMCKKKQVRQIEEQIFHILMHGLLGHFEENEQEDKELAWAVMDIQAKKCKRIFYPEEDFEGYDAWRAKGAEKITDKCIGKELYYRGKEKKKVRNLVYCLGKMAKSDDHRIWSSSDKEKRMDHGIESKEQQDKGKAEMRHLTEIGRKWAEARKLFMNNTGGNTKESQILQLTAWQESKGIKQGNEAGGLQMKWRLLKIQGIVIIRSCRRFYKFVKL